MNKVYPAEGVDLEVVYSRCPDCDALVPMDSMLVHMWLLLSGCSVEILFCCECGAAWSLGAGIRREE